MIVSKKYQEFHKGQTFTKIISKQTWLEYNNCTCAMVGKKGVFFDYYKSVDITDNGMITKTLAFLRVRNQDDYIFIE